MMEIMCAKLLPTSTRMLFSRSWSPS